ncbi:unnamed protein product [Aureobasidium pullulans]|uniref:S-adenosyl-L-methionine-dependent methyltransferase n=1 Tax=Aureobasidium pullulans TaxID=5580 RepID=A0A4S8Y879_AURPU|nr:hypothetical protein D6D24_02372 [Aureobasidium pullulans]THW46187.1 hypothetical protein D6D22_03191 [Aureobasidium pullulans]THZ98341.1 hypothetical protein D6C82_05851 [Aureobasidium pullulans]CAC9888153.1 unnamed protein product [Aureobasidium pullulans]
MIGLTELIREIPATEEDTPEDIFASAPGFLFTDDLRNQHGDPGSIIVYKSQRFGDIELTTADPNGEEERTLFSHYLWNAGILMAERVSGQRLLNEQEEKQWAVEGHNVLELGAGVGLVGIASTLAGATHVCISDYPAQVVLDNIKRNVKHNVPETIVAKARVQGHAWGVLDDDFARANARKFSRVMAADCFWMPWQHENLASSMLHFLSDDPEARVLAMGGFHTGRAKLAAFFDVASEKGLEVQEIYEEDDQGNRREWVKEKDGGRENVTERKKWLTIAILRRGEEQRL